MFEQLGAGDAPHQRWTRSASIALHAALLVWLLRSPEPRLLTANSLALGQNGKSVTRLFWSSKNPDDSTHSSSDLATARYQHQRLGQKLTWTSAAHAPKLAAAPTPVTPAEQQDKSVTQTLS
ncbi:MAG TPA: hypothetical protein VMU05_06855, partial [Dongiaceae bacterium]|nr:hypothetical protein [Dongiaceae bacterium]